MIPIPLRDVAGAVGAAIADQRAGVMIRRVSIDSREVRPGDLFVAIRGHQRDGHTFIPQALTSGAIACLVAHDAAVPRNIAAEHGADSATFLYVRDTVDALGALARFYRRSVMSKSTRVIAITGSNGKTTTKQMIDHLLSAELPGRASPKSFNNNIGVPLTLLSVEKDDRYVVIEIGTNAPGEVSHLAELASPEVAVVTSIGEAHLEGLATVEAIVSEKLSLLDHVRPGGIAIVNVDRTELRGALRMPTQARLVTYGQEASALHQVLPLETSLTGTSFILSRQYRIRLPVPGIHHASNATAAWLVGRTFNLSARRMIERLATFTPGAGRARVVEAGGVTIVDDAYNANPASMSAALATLREFGGKRTLNGTGGVEAQERTSRAPSDELMPSTRSRRVLVMGDMLELGTRSPAYHEELVRAAVDAGIEIVMAVGERFTAAINTAVKGDRETTIIRCASAENVARTLIPLLTRGDCVWIKGSRAMALDRAVQELQDALTTGSADLNHDRQRANAEC